MFRSGSIAAAWLLALAMFIAPVGAAFAQQPDKGFPHKGPGPGKQGDFHHAREGMIRPVHERMSPEDRRQLRRDIDQHGRDIYRGRK